MLDTIWPVIVILIILAVLAACFFYYKMLAQPQNNQRIEPDLQGLNQLNDIEDNSVFNVRVVTGKKNIPPISPQQSSKVKSIVTNENRVNRHNDLSEGVLSVRVVKKADDHRSVHATKTESMTSPLIESAHSITPTPPSIANATPATASTKSITQQLSAASLSVHTSPNANHQSNTVVPIHVAQSPQKPSSLFSTLKTLFKRDLPITPSTSPEVKVSHGFMQRQPVVETIALILRAPENEPYLGYEIFDLIKAFDLPLALGASGFFEQVTTTYFGDEIEFSIANLIHPGRFDVEHIEQLELPGLLFFLDLPTPDYKKDTFDQMLKVAARFGDQLGGELLDAQQAPLTSDSLVQLRNYVIKRDEALWVAAELQQRVNGE